MMNSRKFAVAYQSEHVNGWTVTSSHFTLGDAVQKAESNERMYSFQRYEVFDINQETGEVDFSRPVGRES